MPIDLNQPQIATAIYGGGVAAAISIVTVGVNLFSVRSLHRQRIEADYALAQRKIEVDIALADRKFEFDKDLAERKFQYDREFNDHRRRVELAETVLAEFLQIRHIIEEIRSPGAFNYEGGDRPTWEGETDHQAHSRQIFYVPISRLLKHGDFISGLMAKRYRMNAFFGLSAETPFDELSAVITKIRVSAHMMMSSLDPDGNRRGGEEIWRQWEGAIWAGLLEPDPYAVAVEAAVAAMEAICRPVLTRKD